MSIFKTSKTTKASAIADMKSPRARICATAPGFLQKHAEVFTICGGDRQRVFLTSH